MALALQWQSVNSHSPLVPGLAFGRQVLLCHSESLKEQHCQIIIIIMKADTNVPHPAYHATSFNEKYLH